MDITIEVMLPPRGAVDFSQSAHPKWRVLAPVAVYPLKTVSTIGMPKTGYLHVTGVPPTMSDFTRLSGLLCEEWELPSRVRIERRTFRGDPSTLPPPIQNALLSERQATITWGQCQALFRHQVRNQNLSETDY